MSRPKDSPPNDLGAALRANAREANTFWFWRDRTIGEPGAALEILTQAGVDVVGLVSRNPNDPPDCEATLDGHFSGVEVTELVDQATLERSIRAARDREAGKEPSQPEAFLFWDRDSLLTELQALIDRKDRKTQKGGPYERYALVVPTDETFLDRDTTRRFLEGATFQSQLITDVFLGLSYHDGCCPVFHFAASQRAADGTWTLKLQPSVFVARYDVFPFAGSMVERFPSRESMMQLILKRASASRRSGEWNDDDYDVVADDIVVGRIFNAAASPVGTPWMWTLAFGQHEDRTPSHGYSETREAAMAAFAKSWRRE
jgi:hypothetical protein